MNRLRNIGLMILLLLAGRMAAQVPALDSLCPGAERFYSVTGEEGSTYAWILTLPDNTVEVLPSDADTLQITWNYPPGIYLLEVMQYGENGCDADPVYGEIIIHEPPEVFAGPGDQICSSDPYTLAQSTATHTSSVLWASSGDGAFDYDTALHAVYTAGPNDVIAGSVTLTITGFGLGDEGTCEPSVSSMLLILDPEIVPEFEEIGFLCQDSPPPPLPGTSNNGIPGTWDPPTVTTTVPGTYYYVFTPDEGQCAVAFTMEIKILPLPEVYAGADQTIPNGTSTTIFDATASGYGTLIYSWAPAEFLLDATVLDPTTVNLFVTTTFTLTVTDANGCMNSDSVTIYITGGPLAVSPTAVPDEICLGETAQLYANASGGFGLFTYSWTSDPAGFVSTEANPVVNPLVTTTYTVIVKDDYSTVTGSVTVTVHPLPEVYAGADQTISNGTSTIIGDATASGAQPLTYSWTPAALLLDPTVLNPTTVNLDATTVFTLTVTDGNGCQNSDDMTITIVGGPLAVDPVAVPEEICLGGSSQLYANAGGGSGYYSYNWTSNPSGFTSVEANPLVSPALTTTYIIVVNDGFNTVTDSVTVTVHPLPEVYAGADQLIPAGGSATMGDATASGAMPMIYSWTPAALLLDPAVLNPTTVPLNATTTFTLTVTDANGCENSDQVIIYVSGGSLAVNPTVVPEAICLGGWATLYANASGGSGIYTYAWTSDPPGFVSSDENPVVAPEETTVYYVEVNDGFETVTGSVTLTVHPLPEVYAGADQTIPIGTGTTIGDATATGAEPMTYSWTPAALLLDPTVLNPTTVSLFSNTTFTLTVTDAHGCSASDEMTVTVAGEPLAVNPTADPGEICLGGTVQLFANPSGGTGTYAFSWTSDPPGFFSNEENPLVSPSETTTYLVEVSDGISTATGQVTVTVYPLPEVYAGADQTIPYSTVTTIGDATASGTLPLNYSWTPAAFLLDATVLNPTTVPMEFTVTFTLTVTDGNGCVNSDEMTVFVDGGPLTVEPTADPEETCLGGTVQLYANAANGSGTYTYLWTSVPAGFTSTEANPLVTPLVTTTYFVEVGDGYGTVSGSVTVTVFPLPVVYAGADQTILYGTGTVIGDATATGAEPMTYSWTPAASLLDPNVLNPTTISLEETTTFTLTVTDANGCENSDEMTIFITGGPLTVDPYADPDTICQGGTLQLFANENGGTGNYTFLWTSDPAGFTSTEENPAASPLVTTIYTVEVSDGNSTVTGTVTVTVYPLPGVYAGADQNIIYNTSTVIDDATASGAEPLTFIWEPADLLVDATVLNPTTVNLLETTTFTLTVTDANGCENSDEVIIEIRTITILQAITGPGNHCVGNSIAIPLEVDNFTSVSAFQLKLTYNDDFLECEDYTNVHPSVADSLVGYIDHVSSEIVFQWHSPVPLTFSQATRIVDINFELKQAGLGTLDWYTGDTESFFTDPQGEHIPAEFQSGEVEIYDPPVIFLAEVMPVCVGQPVTITYIAQGTNPPLNYQWTYPTGYVTSIAPSFDSVTMANAGTYTLLVTDAMGCTDQQNIVLMVYENPVALFHGIDSLTVDPGYILEAGSGYASYLWNTSETLDYITIDTAGMYWVEMMSVAGCYGIDSVYIKLVPPECLYIPNAFTPNGDGLNDVFRAVSACPLTYFRMLIYNRWGEQLFESNDISVGWDGRKNGRLCPADAYVYLITYKVEGPLGAEETHVKFGIVISLR